MTRIPPFVPASAPRPAPRSWLSWAFQQRTLAQVARAEAAILPNPLTKR